MQKMISILLAAALALCGLMSLAEQGDSRDDMSRFSIPHIPTPSIPPVEVPEIDEIEVPKVPTAAPTGTPKIEVPEIPEVDVPGLDAPRPMPGRPWRWPSRRWGWTPIAPSMTH